MADELVLGVDIGGSKCVALLGTTGGKVLDRIQWPSEAHLGAQHMLDRIHANIVEMAGRAPGCLLAVGAAIGGPLDARRGVVLSPPNLPGWDNIPLAALLQEWTGKPAFVEHDAAACAVAEYLWGGWGEPEVLAYLTCGTGFGVGIALNGFAYSGAQGRRPEVGHWRLSEDGPEAFGKKGSAEALCSGSGLAKLAAQHAPARWGDGGEPVTPADLVRLASEGDRDANEVIAINARYTGRVCAMLADLLTPNVITLGSLARYLGPTWVEAVRREYATEAEPLARQLTRIEPAALGEQIGELSAIAAAVEGLRILGGPV